MKSPWSWFAFILIAEAIVVGSVSATPRLSWQTPLTVHDGSSEDFEMVWVNDTLVVYHGRKIRGLRGGTERYAFDWNMPFVVIDGVMLSPAFENGVMVRDALTGGERDYILGHYYCDLPFPEDPTMKTAIVACSDLGDSSNPHLFRIRPALCTNNDEHDTCVEPLFDIQKAGLDPETARARFACGGQVVSFAHPDATWRLVFSTLDGTRTLDVITGERPLNAVALDTRYVAVAMPDGAAIIDVPACMASSRPTKGRPPRIELFDFSPTPKPRRHPCVVSVVSPASESDSRVVSASVVALGQGRVALTHVSPRSSTHVFSAAGGPRWSTRPGESLGRIDADTDDVYLVSPGKDTATPLALVARRIKDGREAWRVSLPGTHRELTRDHEQDSIEVASGPTQVAARVGTRIFVVDKPTSGASATGEDRPTGGPLKAP